MEVVVDVVRSETGPGREGAGEREAVTWIVGEGFGGEWRIEVCG